jgi:aspartate-semialdehyde dehydrogenase
MTKKIPVGILGATGMVGQRFIQLLENHPWFEVAWIAASERSAGQSYASAAKWKLGTAIPERVAAMKISEASPTGAPRLIFAALDAEIAKEMEPQFATAGHAVITNSSALRMHDDVPLIIPEVNADHLPLLKKQSWQKSGGFIVTNPNCSTIGLVMALAPLAEKFGVEKVFVVTMQAVSGAGYPGVASMDILGNVVPYIAREEEKMEAEAKKLLGTFVNGSVVATEFAIRAKWHDDIITAWTNYRSKICGMNLPSAPKPAVYYDPRPDRPQPRLDIHRGAGMTTTVGRLRPCNLLEWKFTALSHNTIRGAAGAAILNAELLEHAG